MLKHIHDFAKRKQLSSDNRYKSKYVRYYIVLTDEGDFVGIEENTDKSAKSLCPQYPERVTYGNVANFLVEKGAVIFDKTNKKHINYMNDMQEAAKKSKECECIYFALNNDKLAQEIEAANLLQSQELFSFKIDGKYVEELTSWKSYFEDKYDIFIKEDALKQKSEPMVSVVTGQIVSPLKNTDKVSVGGATTGTGDVIICCDKASYQSYGLEGALNGAISKEESETLKQGLEYLLKNNYHKDWNLVHWYDEDINQEIDVINTLFSPESSFLGDILEDESDSFVQEEKDVKLYEYLNGLLRDGKLTQDFSQLKNTKYFLLNYRPCSGRIAFSNFRTGDFEEMFENLILFYEDSSIQKSYFIKENERFIRKIAIAPIFNIKSILLNTLNSKVEGNKRFEQINKEFSIYKKQELLNAILFGNQIPFDFVQRAVLNIKNKRSSGDTPPTVLYQLLKVYINREQRKKGENETIMQTINTDNKDIAYNLGRLLCVYGKIQESALGNVNASVTDKFYSAASTSPAYVFGRLASTSNYHLKKISNKGLSVYYKKMLCEITSNIDAFPKTLSLVEQANFALGFYQQEQAMYAKKTNNDEVEEEI